MAIKEKRVLSVILFAIFLDLLNNGIIVPVVPQLLANPGSPYYMLPPEVPIGYAYILLGLLIAVFPIIQFFSTPILGEYSDHYGRRKLLTFTLIGLGICFLIFAFGIVFKSIMLLFIARIVGGLTAGNIAIAQAAIADITPPHRRAARFGLIGAAYGVGFILGPVVGAVLSDSHILPWFTASTPFWFAAFLYGVSALAVYFFMGETREATGLKRIQWFSAVAHVVRAYGMKRIRAILGVNFLAWSGVALFGTFFTVFLIKTFSLSQIGVGYYIGYAGIWFVVAQGFVLRFLSKRYDEVIILRWFLLLGALGIFSYYIPTSIPGLLISGALFALPTGVILGALPALASRRAGAHEQGEILGINASVQALAQACPPILAGFLAAKISPSAPIYAAGVVIFVAWLAFVMFVKRNPTFN